MENLYFKIGLSLYILGNLYQWYKQFKINKYLKEIIDYQTKAIRNLQNPPYILTDAAKDILRKSYSNDIKLPKDDTSKESV